MEKKEDLRITRTKANIRRAFLELCQKKPISKITVTELSALAAINKGTFYLHYEDIYALYRETVKELCTRIFDRFDDFSLFTGDPAEFVRRWYTTVRSNEFAKMFPHYTPTELDFQVPAFWLSELKRRIYAANPIEPTPANEIKLDCIISNLLITNMLHYRQQPELVIQTMADVIQYSFP